MTPDEFREAGHALIEMIADYRESVDQRPVRSQSGVGEILDWLPASAPQQGEPAQQLLQDIDSHVVPSMTHWQHPAFYAYFPANADLSSVLGDLASSGFGQLGLNWQSSPPLTEFEDRMCDWMRQLLGLQDSWRGVIQDTASTSSLVALLSAREKAGEFCQTRNGLRDTPELMVYSSAQAHSSVNKAALLAGFGKNQVRSVAVDREFAVDLDDMRRHIEADIAAGRRPCAIVGCTGTTATTAMDNIDGLADLAAEFDCWLHVDGAMAGSAMILPEMRHLWQGIERADSMVFNPHKWLGAVFDCSIYYVRDEQHLIRVMSTNPSYLQTSADGEAPNYRDWGIPLGRRFRSMKLWWLLRCEGADKLRERLRRDIENARWLEQQIVAHPQWQIIAPVALQTLCVVHQPDGMDAAELDDYTQQWCESINASGKAMLTPAVVDGRWVVRISIGALSTERSHVESLWALLQESTRGS
jgi:aromatic-L-amino-acid decarboxylase